VLKKRKTKGEVLMAADARDPAVRAWSLRGAEVITPTSHAGRGERERGEKITKEKRRLLTSGKEEKGEEEREGK
jgi:hypothetical protein